MLKIEESNLKIDLYIVCLIKDLDKEEDIINKFVNEYYRGCDIRKLIKNIIYDGIQKLKTGQRIFRKDYDSCYIFDILLKIINHFDLIVLHIDVGKGKRTEVIYPLSLDEHKRIKTNITKFHL